LHLELADKCGHLRDQRPAGIGPLEGLRALSEWFGEYRLYRRKDGKIVKDRDHCMDATRYLEMSGWDVALRAVA
jgi:hypothetical protein